MGIGDAFCSDFTLALVIDNNPADNIDCRYV